MLQLPRNLLEKIFKGNVAKINRTTRCLGLYTVQFYSMEKPFENLM
jgi:hypothetical protein